MTQIEWEAFLNHAADLKNQLHKRRSFFFKPFKLSFKNIVDEWMSDRLCRYITNEVVKISLLSIFGFCIKRTRYFIERLFYVCSLNACVTEQSYTAWGRVFNPVMTLVTFLWLQLKKRKERRLSKEIRQVIAGVRIFICLEGLRRI